MKPDLETGRLNQVPDVGQTRGPRRHLGRFLAVALLVVLLAPGASSVAGDPETQGDMNDAACVSYRSAEQKMTAVVAAIAKKNRADRAFIAKFNKWQQAWIVLRQAQADAIFPHDQPGEYGSVLPTCRCTILAELTENRTKELMQWTSGIAEGDVCTGSRATKP
jgi:uncharacterized protein YecT (DUF1311 family)